MTRSRLRLLVPVLLAATAVIGGAGPAQARSSAGLQTFYVFKAVFSGSGTYERTITTTDGGGSTKSSFRWATTYKNIFIPRVHQKASVGYPASAAGTKAAGAWQISQTGGDACTGAGNLGRVPPTGPLGDGGLTLKRVSGGLRMYALGFTTLRTTSGAGDGSSACHPRDFWHDIVLTSGVGTQLPDALDPVTGIGKITPSDLRRASFTKRVIMPADEGPDSDCGSGGGNTCSQSYSWTGKVTFTKTKLK